VYVIDGLQFCRHHRTKTDNLLIALAFMIAVAMPDKKTMPHHSNQDK
jgi:hypothetical protein